MGASPEGAVEKEGWGDLQHAGDVLQAAGADAIGALLVFLDLLEGDAERGAEPFLAHPDQHAPHP
jgi:hypothetical protein